MKKLDTRLLRTIQRSKGQFISISVVIMLALTIYVSLSMVADNLNRSMAHYYEITNFGDLFIEVSRVPKGAIDKLTSIEGVARAQGRVSAEAPLRVENPEEKVNVRLVSLPKEDVRISDIFVLEGQRLGDNPKTTAVIGQFYDARGMTIGDKLVPYIGGTEYPLEIVGAVGNPEYIYLMENEQSLLPAPERFGILYVTEAFAQSAFGYQGSYNQVVIQLEPQHRNRIDSISDEIEDALSQYGIRRVIKREQQMSHSVMVQEVDSLALMSRSITFIFLMVAALIINIMLARVVKKDRMAIGVMKGLGYSNANVLIHYTKYAIAIGFVGSFLGILFSIPLSMLMTEIFILYMNIPSFEMRIYYEYFAYGILLTTIFCILSGLFGARSAIKIQPAEAMRPETPKSGKHIWLEDFAALWRRISFSWKLVIRNISRTKRRAMFLALGIALTYAITTVPMFMSNVWDALFGKQYGEFQTMDYGIDFSRPMNQNALREIGQMVEAKTIEPKAEIPLELTYGWRKKGVSVIALDRDTQMYHFKDLSGNPIQLRSKGIYLSEILANMLDVHTGDEIQVRNYLEDKEHTLQVYGIVEQYLGASAYMDLDTMYTLLGEKNIITGALLHSQDAVTDKLKDVPNIRQIQSVQDMQDTLLEFMDMIIASVGILMLFGGVLGFAIVYNVTIISINERMMEFSSLRVLGFNKRQIYRMVTRENMLIAVVGVMLGIPLGYLLCNSMVDAISTEMYIIPAILTPTTYVLSAIATLAYVGIAQLATIRKIHNLNLLDALKNRVS